MREKQGVRELFEVLYEKYGVLSIQKGEAARVMGLSARSMERLYANGEIVPEGHKVSLWQIARFLVG